VVKPGDWIADVTYERQNVTVNNRFYKYGGGPPPPVGLPNPFHKNEWDNLPAQRCIWYQVQKVLPAGDDTSSRVFPCATWSSMSIGRLRPGRY
jgi:hypothetical protein